MGRTYVVTGAGSGIGRATADRLLTQGATVVGVDLRGADIQGDLSTATGRRAAVKAAVDAASGSVDAVIACAGIALPKPLTASVNYFGMTEFLTLIRPVLAQAPAPRAALVSSVSCIHPNHPQLVDALVADDEGAALKIASNMALDEGSANLVYQSTKRAISLWLRREAPTAVWAGAGIPLNAVAPGLVTTPMTAELLGTADGASMMNAIVPTPLNGHQSPESIADLLIWLTSEQNSHMCGQTLYCDGGAEVVLRGTDAYSWADAAMSTTFAEISAKVSP
ncbi:SDR family oxidoreductase [Paenarthrobacter aromaticivorans]|uniref:SDR family oxidoreductase n=1 Tax=Paenarthrobacter aromaticivorans TaxID=2849150 RepID=A0ABS6I473_9MICC|nr:SDR family oxidoreductase [Paenarthrobacter sp. MMS21-TAE1-1]MBU8865628.1 SDR family oxidoreductase [Paenarthrobacter sp. MMS21-TAE1-1]